MTATYPDPNLSTAAREWADRIRNTSVNGYPTNADCYSAAELILSLPDTVVDGDKLRKVIADWGNCAITSDAYALYQQVLALLPAPSLPTLAELIEDGNDPQKYQWMQCTVDDRGDDTFVIVMVREDVTKVLHPDGMHEVKRNSQVFPLLDEPKLEWPDSHADTITAESEEDVLAGLVAGLEPALPRPEDVPAGEAWLIKYDGKEMESIKTWDPRHPWTVSDKRIIKYGRDAYSNRCVTLISRLVPKTP